MTRHSDKHQLAEENGFDWRGMKLVCAFTKKNGKECGKTYSLSVNNVYVTNHAKTHE